MLVSTVDIGPNPHYGRPLGTGTGSEWRPKRSGYSGSGYAYYNFSGKNSLAPPPKKTTSVGVKWLQITPNLPSNETLSSSKERFLSMVATWSIRCPVSSPVPRPRPTANSSISLSVTSAAARCRSAASRPRAPDGELLLPPSARAAAALFSPFRLLDPVAEVVDSSLAFG